MKIPITRTQLYGTPDFAWNLFCRVIKDKNEDYNPVQETASLCFTYYSEIYDYREWGDTDFLEEKRIEEIEEKEWYHGHLDFFNYCETSDVNSDDLVQALETIGALEFVKNFQNAIEHRKNENCLKEDVWFVEHEEVLLGAIREYWRSNLEEYYEIIDEDYSMHPPKDGFWVAAFITGFVCIMMIIASLTNPDPDDRMHFLFISIYSLLSVGVILFIYAKRWKMTIKKDEITIRFLFLLKIRFNFNEITETRWRTRGVIIHAHGKRVLYLRNDVKGYSTFCTQLGLDGKQFDEPVIMTIRRSISKKIEGFMWPLAFIVFLTWSLSRQVNPAGFIEITILSMPIPVAFIYTIHNMRWKITVFESYVRVRTVFNAEKEYKLTDIVKVELKKKRAFFFTSNGKSFNMEYGEGYNELTQTFINKGIPFYKDGKLI